MNALADMLGSMSPATFTAEYWNRRPLFIKGCAGKLEKLFPGGFGRKDLYRAARESAARNIKGFQLLARRPHFAADEGRPQPHAFIEPHQMEWMFDAGANVRADGISDLRVAAFASAVKTQLNHPGDVFVAATLSPEGNGWPPHVDRSSVVFIQCEGRKRFVISPGPVTPWPRMAAVFSSDGSVEKYDAAVEPWEEICPIDMSRLIEFVLEPGDILFLPPGTVHATEALSEASLTMDMLFEHSNFLDLVCGALDRIFENNPDWRQVPPGAGSEFFAARLAELRGTIEAFTPSAPELNRQWQRSIAYPGQTTAAILEQRT